MISPTFIFLKHCNLWYDIISLTFILKVEIIHVLSLVFLHNNAEVIPYIIMFVVRCPTFHSILPSTPQTKLHQLKKKIHI